MQSRTLTFTCTPMIGETVTVVLRDPTNEEIEDYRLDTQYATRNIDMPPPADLEDDEKYKTFIKTANRARQPVRIAWYDYLVTPDQPSVSDTVKLEIIRSIENKFTVVIKNS